MILLCAYTIVLFTLCTTLYGWSTRLLTLFFFFLVRECWGPIFLKKLFNDMLRCGGTPIYYRSDGCHLKYDQICERILPFKKSIKCLGSYLECRIISRLYFSLALKNSLSEMAEREERELCYYNYLTQLYLQKCQRLQVPMLWRHQFHDGLHHPRILVPDLVQLSQPEVVSKKNVRIQNILR